MFQSTHPRRVRRHQTQYFDIESSFNPRTHVGCDVSLVNNSLAISRFNPRTHVGCDDALFGCSANATQFQSTHPRRVRLVLLLVKVLLVVSIHAPT